MNPNFEISCACTVIRLSSKMTFVQWLKYLKQEEKALAMQIMINAGIDLANKMGVTPKYEPGGPPSEHGSDALDYLLCKHKRFSEYPLLKFKNRNTIYPNGTP